MGLTKEERKKLKSDRVSAFMKWQRPRKPKTYATDHNSLFLHLRSSSGRILPFLYPLRLTRAFAHFTTFESRYPASGNDNFINDTVMTCIQL